MEAFCCRPSAAGRHLFNAARPRLPMVAGTCALCKEEVGTYKKMLAHLRGHLSGGGAAKGAKAAIGNSH